MNLEQLGELAAKRGNECFGIWVKMGKLFYRRREVEHLCTSTGFTPEQQSSNRNELKQLDRQINELRIRLNRML